MTRATHRTGWLLLVTLLVGLVSSPAAGQDGDGTSTSGEEHELLADAQGWASATQAGPLGDPVGNTTMEPGDLPVGLTGTDETKRSYLLLDVPPEATAATLTLERSDAPGTSYGTPGVILACLVTEPFVLANGQPIDEAPAVDCEDEITGRVVSEDDGEDPAGAYTFALDPLLDRRDEIAEGQQGLPVALVADTRAAGNYQFTFHADYFAPIGTYTVPAEGGDDGGDEPFVPPPPPPTTTGDQDSFEYTPPPRASQPAVPFEAFTSDPPTSEPAPEVASGSGTGAPSGEQQEQVLAAAPFELLPVNPAVWLLVPFGLAVLWAAGRGLGRAGEPVSSLDRLLAG